MRISKKEITNILGGVTKRQTPLSRYIPSAILMLFFEQDSKTSLVYIRRTTGPTLYSGHIAFPGGKIDAGDRSSRDAATRETFEEIGVPETAHQYVGEMGWFETLTSNHDAAAHVAWSPVPVSFKKDAFEVAEIIPLPVELLYRQLRTDLDFGNREEVISLNFQYHPPNGGSVVNLWGLTARITHHFLAGLAAHLDAPGK